MPSTIKQIADICGVSKPTVTAHLKDLGVWDFHVTVGDNRTPTVVDDEATQMVIADLTGKRRPKTEAPEAPTDDERVKLLQERVHELLDQLRDVRAERDRLASQNSELTKKVIDQADEIRALPAPGAVEAARVEGERDGRDAGAKEGALQERSKIAAMGFWARRRYLRG